MTSVLVTGGSGFVGSQLIRRLAAHHRVKCLVRPATLAAMLHKHQDVPQVEWISGDLSDSSKWAAELEQVDQVYHVAGLTKAMSPGQFMEVNEGGTRRLLQACANSRGAKRVLIVSSLAAAGPAADGHDKLESEPPAPVSLYGRSKLAGEQVAHDFADQLAITIVRPPIVFGPGDRDGFEMFRAIHQTGLHLVPGYRDYRVSLIHVFDLADALLQLMNRGETLPTQTATNQAQQVNQPTDQLAAVQLNLGQGIYYVATEQTPSYAELGRLVGTALGRHKTRVLRAPIAAVYGAAVISQWVAKVTQRPSILNVDKVREARAGHWVCLPDKWKQQFHATPMALPEILQQTADWYREQGWLK